MAEKTQIPHLAKTQENHIQESQKVSPFLAGDPKASRSRQDSKTRHINNKMNPRKKHHLVTASKEITVGLYMFDGTYPALISDVDQGRLIHLICSFPSLL